MNLIEKISRKYFPVYYNKIRRKAAIKKARQLWIKTGRRHYVLPLLKGNDYFVCNRDILLKMNQNMPNKKKLTALDLVQMAVYVTPAGTYHLK